MRLKDSLTDIIERLEPAINKLDNAYLAFGVYAAGRLGDITTTILGIEKYGFSEDNPVAQFFMERFGMREGLILPDLLALALLLGVYKIFSKVYPKSRNIIPYVAGILSIGFTLRNLYFINSETFLYQ